MGREVRMVPPDWEHPKNAAGRYMPMLDMSYADAVREWEQEELPSWIEGERLWREEASVRNHDGTVQSIDDVVAESRRRHAYRVPETPTYEWWAGPRPEKPDPLFFMPDWPAASRTHLMMYEDTSEGTPISPAFATPEELAKWLVENKADAGARGHASYEAWLRIAKGGFCPTAVIQFDGLGGSTLVSGVEATKGLQLDA